MIIFFNYISFKTVFIFFKNVWHTFFNSFYFSDLELSSFFSCIFVYKCSQIKMVKFMRIRNYIINHRKWHRKYKHHNIFIFTLHKQNWILGGIQFEKYITWVFFFFFFGLRPDTYYLYSFIYFRNCIFYEFLCYWKKYFIKQKILWYFYFNFFLIVKI